MSPIGKRVVNTQVILVPECWMLFTDHGPLVLLSSVVCRLPGRSFKRSLVCLTVLCLLPTDYCPWTPSFRSTLLEMIPRYENERPDSSRKYPSSLLFNKLEEAYPTVSQTTRTSFPTVLPDSIALWASTTSLKGNAVTGMAGKRPFESHANRRVMMARNTSTLSNR